jgi:hypothetical protein
MRPPLLDVEDQLILHHIFKANHPKAPGLEEKSRGPTNPLFVVIQEERVVIGAHPRDRRERAQREECFPRRGDEDPI